MNSKAFAQPLMRHSEGHVVLGGEQTIDAGMNKPYDYPGREQPYEHRFSPYDFNGGTVAGVSGEDYLVIAADTRLSSGYEILSRNTTKLHQLNPNSILASSGCKTDMDQLRSVLDIKSKVSIFGIAIIVAALQCRILESNLGFRWIDHFDIRFTNTIIANP